MISKYTTILPLPYGLLGSGVFAKNEPPQFITTHVYTNVIF
jgi:hypothetical protein